MPLYQSSRIRLALVRPLAQSFLNALTQHAPCPPIDAAKAHEQHERYAKLLQRHVSEQITVPVDENYPDCCFIEDTALVIGDDVVITRIGAESRRGESKAVAKVFRALSDRGFGFNIHHLKEPATLDGGDVLQMGGRLFVGQSARSNAEAVTQLKAILTMPVVSIPVTGGLHLKSVLSALDDRTLLAADTPEARGMAKGIMAALPVESEPRCVWVPDVISANVLRLGSILLIQAGFPESEVILRKLAEELRLEVIAVDMSELIKADSALTCCSLLIP
ncbi:MAG: hypothetical protein H7249_11295 [Chitinophagaceae bacterium]|nr:hypothetical protein [Oligoflexus sp.]